MKSYQKFKRSFLLCVISFTCLLEPSELSACASCGSGFSDPIFLAPDESLKTILSLGYSTLPYTISPRRVKNNNTSMTNKKINFDFGAAYRLSSIVNVGLYWGLQNNRTKVDDSTSPVDPTASLRFHLSNQSFLTPYLPQVQVLASFRPRSGRGTVESKRLDAIDVTGSDFSRASLGIDLWNSMNWIFYGFSHSIEYSFKRDIDDYRTQLGNLYSTLFTSGFYYYGYNKAVIGYANLYRDERTEDGESRDTSDMLQHGLFLTLDYSFAARQQFRLSLNKSGIGSSRNTTESTAVTLGYLKTWL